jgi:predicted enzyme related to lactoylglutathione lyase
MSNRIVHFEIHADDPERAADFYRSIFGWEITKWEGGQMEYWMVMTAPKDSKELGINGGLLRRSKDCLAPVPQQAVTAFVCTIIVDNIDETIKKLEAAGSICALPKMALAGMAWQAYYIDTEQNIFGIHQVDPNAK